MSSLPPSQAFLNAPDDFLRSLRTPPGDTGSSSRLQHSTDIRDDSSQTDNGSAQNIPKNESSKSNDPQGGIPTRSDLNHEQQPENDHITPAPSHNTNSLNPTNTHNAKAQMDYEMHYGLSQRSVKEVIREILDDITTRKNLHDWDEKLIQSPFKRLENVIRNHLATCSQEMLNSLLNQSSVEEVTNAGGKLESIPAMQHGGEVQSHLFFSKECNTRVCRVVEVSLTSTQNASQTIPKGTVSSNPWKGRIM